MAKERGSGDYVLLLLSRFSVWTKTQPLPSLFAKQSNDNNKRRGNEAMGSDH